MLAKLLVTDLDDYRDLTAAEANSMRYLTQSLKMQLRYKGCVQVGHIRGWGGVSNGKAGECR